jgi:PAS domain S-box-containing protein
MVLRFLCKNGSWCFLESSGTNLLADEAVAGLVINSRDVTERFRVQEALRQSEVRFRAIFEGAALGIALSDPSGELLTTNPAMHKLFGYTEEELRQRTITHPDDVTADFNLYQALLAGSLPSYQMEKRYFHKNGNLVWGRLTVSLVGIRQEAHCLLWVWLKTSPLLSRQKLNYYALAKPLRMPVMPLALLTRWGQGSST